MEGTEQVVTPRSQRWVVLGAIVAFVAVVGVAVAVPQRSDDEELRPLALGSPDFAEAGVMADAAMQAQEISYELAGELPDLGSEAPVHRLVAPEMNTDMVRDMAATLGVGGTVEASDGGWTISDSEATFQVGPTTGGWWVSYGAGFDADQMVADAESVSAGSDADSTTVTTGVDPGVAVVTTTVPEGPQDLPTEDEAEQIARDLVASLGVEGEWEAAVNPGGVMGFAVACAEGEECPESETQETVLSWSVTLGRLVDGVEATGLEWAVEVGDGGAIQGVWGTIADLESMGSYPLRTTTEVFADLEAGEGVYPGPVPLGMEVPAVQAPAADAADGAGVSSAEAGQSTVTHTVPCPENARCPDGVLVEPMPATSLSEGSGGEIAPGEPVPGEPVPGEPIPVDPEEPAPPPLPGTVPPAEQIVVTITDAQRASMLYPATEEGVAVTYLVPTYRYLGAYEDGSEFRSYDLLALDEAYVEVPTTTVATSTEPPPSTEPPFTSLPPVSGSVPTTFPATTLAPTSPVPTVATSVP